MIDYSGAAKGAFTALMSRKPFGQKRRKEQNTMAIIDRIKYDGLRNGAPWLIYKFPSDEFVLGSQLIVNQGQEALFLKGGEALDLFGAGTHTLSTGNLPVLKRFVNLPFGGKTPFAAEVYFVNKTVNLSMNWGTSTAIPLEDPKYGLLLNVGAYGQYGITVADTRLFVSRMIGALPNGTLIDPVLVLKYFNGLINTKIKTVTASYMIGKKISFLEITSYLDELSETFRKALEGEFERFGIELVNFYCESIAPRPEEYEKLRNYKEELALGNDFYVQRRSLDIMDKMARNPATAGLANAGIGLGMGMNMANQAGGLFAGLSQSVRPVTAQEQPQTATKVGSTCPHCGMKNAEGAKFCGNCGEKLAVSVVCPHCGKEIPMGLKFCCECGGSLNREKCPACGTENAPGAKFCGNCGAKL